MIDSIPRFTWWCTLGDAQWFLLALKVEEGVLEHEADAERRRCDEKPEAPQLLKSIVDLRRPIDEACGELFPHDDESEEKDEYGDISP